MRKVHYSLYRNQLGYGYCLEEIAEMLGVSTTKVIAWHNQGLLKEKLNAVKEIKL